MEMSLKKFIQSASTCVETDDLASVWQRLGQMGCDWAIVLNEQQAPLGVLRLSRLIPYLSLTKSWVDDALATQTIQQIGESLGQDRQPLLEDLTPLSLQWSLENFRPPILFWNYQTHRAELNPLAQSTVEQVWGNRTEVIPGSLPMPELLARVNQVLGR